MSAFPDTSFLCALYRTEEHSPQADEFMAKLKGPLPVSSLVLLEFRQSVRLHTRLHAQDPRKGISIEQGQQLLRSLQQDLNARVFEPVPVDWAEVHLRAESLSAAHTPGEGQRLVDILQVATALHLGASIFLTFDANQRRMAEAEGLVVPFREKP